MQCTGLPYFIPLNVFFFPQAMRLTFLIYFSVSVPWACLSTNLKTFSKLVKLFGRKVSFSYHTAFSRWAHN